MYTVHNSILEVVLAPDSISKINRKKKSSVCLLFQINSFLLNANGIMFNVMYKLKYYI